MFLETPSWGSAHILGRWVLTCCESGPIFFQIYNDATHEQSSLHMYDQSVSGSVGERELGREVEWESGREGQICFNARVITLHQYLRVCVRPAIGWEQAFPPAPMLPTSHTQPADTGWHFRGPHRSDGRRSWGRTCACCRTSQFEEREHESPLGNHCANCGKYDIWPVCQNEEIVGTLRDATKWLTKILWCSKTPCKCCLSGLPKLCWFASHGIEQWLWAIPSIMQDMTLSGSCAAWVIRL